MPVNRSYYNKHLEESKKNSMGRVQAYTIKRNAYGKGLLTYQITETIGISLRYDAVVS